MVSRTEVVPNWDRVVLKRVSFAGTHPRFSHFILILPRDWNRLA